MKEASNHNNLSGRLSCLKVFIPLSHILFGWSWLDTWYYGSRYAKNCHPKDLWSSYFTSSVHVAIQRWLYGEPDVIEVRRTFQTREKSKSWESKVLRRMRVVKSEHWLNKTDNRCPTTTGLILGPRSEETKQKIRQSLFGRSIPHKGTTHTDEWKKNISSSLKRQDEV